MSLDQINNRNVPRLEDIHRETSVGGALRVYDINAESEVMQLLPDIQIAAVKGTQYAVDCKQRKENDVYLQPVLTSTVVIYLLLY